MIAALIALALIFTQLSLVAFGGGNTILPDIERQVVTVHHWMTAEQFSALFALAQAAPGPNLMIVPLIGWHVAGLPGVCVASLAKFGPSSLVTGAMLHLWNRFRDHPWRAVVQSGIVPITAGLVLSSAIVIARASTQSIGLAAIALGACALSTMTRLHPLALLGGGALFGLIGVARI